jgi:hypothetical protein
MFVEVLGHGIARQSGIAGLLGKSGRALRRKLAACGSRFSSRLESPLYNGPQSSPKIKSVSVPKM